jgi:protein-S-isoprenylcysteine O-methyltransferase Ste14
MSANESLFRCLLIALFMTFTAVRGYHVLKNSAVKKEAVPAQFREAPLSRIARFLAFLGLFSSIVAYTLVLIMTVPRIDSFALPLPDALRFIGMGVGVSGVLGLHAVHRALGKHFSAELELNGEHALITSGPYQLIRHPMYTCLFMVFIGGALISANALIAGFALANIVVLSLRVKKEEALMAERFKEYYAEYCSRTGRFLPF